jgi:hypothetical protein
MSTHRKAGRALRAGFGLALVGALALVSGCGSGDAIDESGEPGEPSSGEATDALESSAPVGMYKCTLAGALISGSLVVYPGAWGRTTCSIYAPELPGSSSLFCSGAVPFRACPECNDLRTSFGCPYR